MDFVDFGGIGQFINKNSATDKKIGFSLTFNDANVFNLSYHFQCGFGRFLGLRTGQKKGEKNEDKKIKTLKLGKSCLDILIANNFSKFTENINQPWLNEDGALEVKIEVMFNLKKALEIKESKYADLSLAKPDLAFYLNGIEVFTLKGSHKSSDEEFETEEEREIKSTIDGTPARIFINNNIELEPIYKIFEEAFLVLKEKRPEEKLDLLIHQIEMERRYQSPIIRLQKESDAEESRKNKNEAKEIFAALSIFDFRGRSAGLEIFPSININELNLLQKNVTETGKLPADCAGLILLDAIGDCLKEASKNFFDKPKYLAAYRVYPKWFVSEYDILGTDQNDPYGTNALNILRDTKTRKRLSQSCKDLGADFEFIVGDKESEAGGFLKVKSEEDKAENTKKNLSYRDIGFGWSQVVPVLFELIKEDFSFFMCEQPELHLHPTTQSQLMEVVLKIFSENRTNEETSFFGGKKIFFELHSEQMILRLLSIIKNKAKKKFYNLNFADDLFSVLFVEKSKKSSRIHEIKIKSNGTLSKEWPGGMLLESAIKDMLTMPGKESGGN